MPAGLPDSPESPPHIPPCVRVARRGRALVRYGDGRELHLFVYRVVLDTGAKLLPEDSPRTPLALAGAGHTTTAAAT